MKTTILQLEVVTRDSMSPNRIRELLQRVLDNGYNESQEPENSTDLDCKDLSRIHISDFIIPTRRKY